MKRPYSATPRNRMENDSDERSHRGWPGQEGYWNAPWCQEPTSQKENPRELCAAEDRVERESWCDHLKQYGWQAEWHIPCPAEGRDSWASTGTSWGEWRGASWQNGAQGERKNKKKGGGKGKRGRGDGKGSKKGSKDGDQEETMADIVRNLRDISMDTTEEQIVDHIGRSFQEWTCRVCPKNPTKIPHVLSVRLIYLREANPPADADADKFEAVVQGGSESEVVKIICVKNDYDEWLEHDVMCIALRVGAQDHTECLGQVQTDKWKSCKTPHR